MKQTLTRPQSTVRAAGLARETMQEDEQNRTILVHASVVHLASHSPSVCGIRGVVAYIFAFASRLYNIIYVLGMRSAPSIAAIS